MYHTKVFREVYQPQISGPIPSILQLSMNHNTTQLAVAPQYHPMRPLGNLGGAGLALSLIEGVPLGI